MASFYVIRGKDNGQHFPICGAVATIGREAVNQIRLRDTEVSRYHAKVIRVEGGGHRIEDNGSSNGTFINSRRIDGKVLQSGDRVQVGRTLMIYTGGPEPNPQQASNAVVIVAEQPTVEPSHIRSSLESMRVSHASLLGIQEPSSLLPAESPSATEPSASAVVSDDQPSSDWEIIYQVSQAISRTVDLDDLLNQVLDLIFQWIECDRGCFLMLDDVTGQLTPTYSRDRKAPLAGKQAGRRLTISRTILDHVMSTKEGVLTSNAQDDARWENVESIASLGVQEAICVPMLGRYGLVGAIYVDTAMSAGLYAERQGRTIFEHQHLKLMLAIAGQAALAIEDTQFYRAMLQAERLATMGQTIANLSHHVKNILQGVSGGSFLVQDGLKKQDLEVIRKGWAIVERNQDRIGNLVLDMLSFSKDRELEMVRSDLRILLDEVVELVQTRANEFNCELDWQRPAQPVLVEFDHEALHRSVLNVLTNAIDAVSQAERVDEHRGQVALSVELSQLKNYVRIHVADNGPGIAEADLGRIFSPFESTKGSRGTGLGLPVSQKVLREHGGDIDVASRVGEGTTFTLHWPAYHDKSADATAPDASEDWSNRATL
ncbi:MAG: FHA domain-containing protein [Pirellulaceae bacterium]|nr:FHA domain-containing protein [Pirellulaceae bacterium]